MARRATFPYVRQDRDDGLQLHNYSTQFMPQQPYPPRQDTLYDSPHQEPYIPSMNNSPHPPYHEFDDTPIKLEDASVMVPQQGFYRPPSTGDCHPMTMSYLSAHSGLPVQHTDDAASKETQYLRRRCFNCHTTEPPSWRRSTLNPGKIVCNKCGLYERTHLRPRPLRFDELRAGNKARKQSQSKGTLSPKAKMALVKKEPREFGLVRRASVSSTSSAHSSSGASDWDDSLSVYSNGSNPPSSFNSPNPGTFPLSRDSQSPPHEGGIRLPNAPLSELASMQASSAGNSPQPPTMSPRKSHTAPAPYYSPPTGTVTLNGDIYRREVPLQNSPSQQPQEPAQWSHSITSSPQAPRPTELTIPPAPVDVESSPEVQNTIPVTVTVPAAST
jgi:GATA-binding protein